MRRANPRRPAPLKRRREPLQARARLSVERFLDATAQLLSEIGFEAITTNEIAERAGVNVSSLYKYFPNKYAVFAALAERSGKRRRALVGQAIAEIGEGRDWREWTDVAIDELVRQMRTEPGVLELDRALRAAPELREVNGQTNREIVRALVDFLRSDGRYRGTDAQLEAVIYVVVESSAALAQLAADPPIDGDRLLTEWKRMLISYLENFQD
jgi:AcrR family transcriptional regulator